uniref:Uncharacterized protein n=1 Tax=Oryza brachyantha TaxID=4533 RepID=J3MIP0_ORYBR
MTSSPLVLTVLLFASLTGLLVLAPRSSSPMTPAKEEEAVVVVGDGKGGGDGGEDDDLALLRRATLDAGEGAAMAMAPAGPKVAFMFLTNSDLTFAPLWERFFEGHGERINVYIEVLSGEPQMQSRYAARGDDAMLPEVPFDRFRVGSQFFTLARRHAVLVVRERRLWRKFRQPCLNPDSCYPEEHYFPTLLDMADPAGVARYTLTHVNWTGSVHGHPHKYTADEVSAELVADLRRSKNATYDYMFARKFSPECLGPLMDIADTVLFND